MKSVTDYVVQLQKLTQQNLDILSAINDSFLTKQNHLSVTVGESRYALPSFISLENKLNTLLSNFHNLVHAPESGEAYFNIDGNSRSIEVKSYTTTPNSLVLTPVQEFHIENNDIFKDFMTPIPHINLDVKDLPNDIVQVLVKKVIPVNNELINLFSSSLQKKEGNQTISLPSVQYSYKDLYKILNRYTQDVDYIEYDTKIDLPIRKNIGSGIYVIESIVDDWIDENLINYITIKFRSDMQDSIYMNSLKYRLFDETIEKPLRVGDKLITFEGNAKVEVTEIQTNTNTITVKLESGEFLNLIPTNSNNPEEISSLSKMKFFSPIDFDADKVLKVSLEEDQYIFIAAAALNNRMNVQSAWGSGLMVNTFELTNGDIQFDQYYRENVKNVGDVLFEITSMMSNTLTGYSKAEYEAFSQLEPIIDTNNLIVTQINRHLNDSVAVQNIRTLYSQKKDLQNQLNEVLEEINGINNTLASISFDDTTGVRSAYVSQLTDLSSRKNDLNTSISKILTEIATSANNSEVPIENGKYHIRGFFDYETFLKENSLSSVKDHVKGIRVQYRYKNIDQEQGLAMSINDKFVFSDWNDMEGFDRERIPSYNNGYQFNIEANNDKVNEPSFNQIDIPISQGETVDIRLKLVYDYGYPFIYTTSNWSPIINIKFPEEYLKDIQILDIIEENNNDIESNRFTNLLKDQGIPEHIGDKITDQDITYYHKPENIASGFYTAERRIIPLKDKLSSLDASLIELRDEVYGTSGESLYVTIKHGESENELLPYQSKTIMVENVSTLNTSDESDEETKVKYEGIYEISGTKVSTVMNLSLKNNSSHSIKLFSMFPGDRDIDLKTLSSTGTKFKVENYASDTSLGVWFKHPAANSNKLCEGTNGTGKSHTFKPSDEMIEASIQGGNQFIYFRIKDIHTDNKLYDEDRLKKDSLENTTALYPSLNDRYSLCVDSDRIGSYLTLGPNEEILIPLIYQYSTTNIGLDMSFEIYPSLYKDPIPYRFKVIQSGGSTQDKVLMANKKKYRSWWNDGMVKFNSIFK